MIRNTRPVSWIKAARKEFERFSRWCLAGHPAVKFSLVGDRGLDIFQTGYPKAMQIGCSDGMPVDAIEEPVTAGGSGLRYDPATDTYT